MAEKTAGRVRPGAMAFVLLTVALSWSIWIATWLATGQPTEFHGQGAMTAAIYAGSFGPGVAAAILSAISRPGSLKEWLRGFTRLRCGWRAYAAALMPFPLALLLLTIALGYAPRPEGLHGMAPILLYLTVFPVSIFNGVATAIMGAGPLGEEGGWRGYLLPRLLEQGGEVRASLIIGIVWALWHLPIMAMFADWRSGVPFIAYLPLYTLGVIGLSFVMSRVWLIGRGSLIPCIWLHGLVNAVGGIAFDRNLWASRWPQEAGTFHFAIAAALTAAFLFWAGRSKRHC
ncbi:CPBP family intramembrane metalloprotease [Sphingomonas sp. 2R-10]|uniref:CPBP family intramembrane glutamic endopeptidase n=1 Tax=Sphingomonas sp. 2R-10 TaxID=3045148 RepID=UPI0024B98191|nr:CPBP family intramembrane glutamic endopeptidase [Sphingomonas sp. 2R-10]MDJ0276065.1 CPBP family intramembrane metalloprotease [Sphingomonas sp. 2R-10]